MPLAPARRRDRVRFVNCFADRKLTACKKAERIDILHSREKLVALSQRERSGRDAHNSASRLIAGPVESTLL
jgi:hypothetical protein